MACASVADSDEDISLVLDIFSSLYRGCKIKELVLDAAAYSISDILLHNSKKEEFRRDRLR